MAQQMMASMPVYKKYTISLCKMSVNMHYPNYITYFTN